MTFCLQAGLMFRRGERTLELMRELPDGRLALEDCLTRRQAVFDRAELLKQVWSGRLAILDQGAAAPTAARAAAPSIQMIASLKPAARQELERRMTYLKGLDQAHVSLGRRAQIAKVIDTVASRLNDTRKPSTSAVMRWARQLHAAQGYAGAVVDKRATRKASRRISPVMEQIIVKALQQVYLTRARNSLVHTQAVIHAEAAKRVRAGQLTQDDARISLATLSRRVADVDRYRVIEARQGSARARLVCRTSMDGAAASYPLQRVEVDHTPMNWVVVCDRTGLPLGRPLLTVLIDAFSNYVLGFYVSFYGAGLTSVSGALRCAIQAKDEMTQGLPLSNRWLAAGVPDRLMLDNGLEFHSPVFQLMGWELRMDFTYCQVRTPWLKPHVERFFSTLDTLTLAKGRIHKRIANVVEIDPIEGAAVMFSDFVKGIVQFVVDVHPFQINQRKLARPHDLFVEGVERRPPVHFPRDMEALRMASARSAKRTVGPGGVEIQGLPFGGPELLDMRKRHGERFLALVKWDLDDMSQIWVQDPQTKQWVVSGCRWRHYAEGLSWNQHLAIRKFARQELKNCNAVEYLEQARLRLHEHWMDSTGWKTRVDRKLAAIAAGYTSARVLARDDLQPPADKRCQALPEPPIPVCEEEYETVVLKRGGQWHSM
ncbi:Mu transposase C-terminal domain-containing protein [Mitsuaria sp. BK037]|uniref:Mu transposase C-terminal domain-containing protein n=1 Tax=Mitsuaria sp. BK037 TaxID=2587122 RepID=UPI00161D9B5F|nr:Mu transposase C-terminal domain-containing protein [Mitsuaria sp. BK037]MBB3285020.1 putative transposase [Mitsuaria sp. BK037]